MENSAHGGVMTLLRMARTRCGVALAFAALRNTDGRFAIAAFPPIGDDATWSIEAIEELAHLTWEDPSLLSGPVLVRTTRLLSRSWPAGEHQAKLAAVPLADPGAPDLPWGLLCVAEPLKGYFEHDELQALSALALRLTSYLRARQELFDGTFDGTAEPAASETLVPEPAATGVEPALFQPTVAGQVGADFPEPAAGPGPATGHAADAFAADAFAADAFAADAFPGTREAGGLEAENPLTPTPYAPLEAPANPVTEGEPAVNGSRQPVASEAAQIIIEALAPDPLTGLQGLPSLLAHLGRFVSGPRPQRASGVLVVELVPAAPGEQLADAVLTTAAAALRAQVRGDDLVARVGRHTFAVAVELRDGNADSSVVRRRIVETLAAAMSSLPVAPAIRSALALAVDDARPEELLRNAARQLTD